MEILLLIINFGYTFTIMNLPSMLLTEMNPSTGSQINGTMNTMNTLAQHIPTLTLGYQNTL